MRRKRMLRTARSDVRCPRVTTGAVPTKADHGAGTRPLAVVVFLEVRPPVGALGVEASISPRPGAAEWPHPCMCPAHRGYFESDPGPR